MRVVKKTNLVPVRVLKEQSRYRSGRIIGVAPLDAKMGVEDGEYELVPIGKDIETYNYPDPGTPAVPGERVQGGKQQSNTGSGGGVLTSGNFTGSVEEIPEDWENGHHLQRIALAKRIFSDFQPPEGMAATEYADRKLRDEVKRRQAAANEESGGAAG